MKNVKYLLFLSIFCSSVLFNACSEDEDPITDNSTTVLDADGDGVADANDTCADTPSGETVDSSGCSDSQKDTDSDGVTDDLDTCEDTAEGTTVDGNGCSDSQKDTDGDGVTDDLDTCPNTPDGATVDENGCADSQKDTDGDGVTDDLDTCPETAEDVTVDQNGCADSQKDTDGDGVTDDLDKCSDTAEDVTVDQNGCADSQTFLGDASQGGIVFYIFQEGNAGYVAGEIHGLTAATVDQSTEDGAQWGCYETEITGADGTAIGTGAQNTLDILAGCSEDGIAAKLAADYEVTVDGVTYDDWFLPSRGELNELYLNKIEVGSFTNTTYCSSSEKNANEVYPQDFTSGNQFVTPWKNYTFMVRSVRTF